MGKIGKGLKLVIHLRTKIGEEFTKRNFQKGKDPKGND